MKQAFQFLLGCIYEDVRDAAPPSTTMSKFPDGTYYIYNRVESPQGERLVITYNGQAIPPTMSASAKAPNQQVVSIFSPLGEG